MRRFNSIPNLPSQDGPMRDNDDSRRGERLGTDRDRRDLHRHESWRHRELAPAEERGYGERSSHFSPEREENRELGRERDLSFVW